MGCFSLDRSLLKKCVKSIDVQGDCRRCSCRHHGEYFFGNCLLKTAEKQDSVTLEFIGSLLGVTRERVRQIEGKALIKIYRKVNHKYAELV